MSSVTIEKPRQKNVIAAAFNGAQSECHGSTATKTQFGIQSSPLLETVSPDKLVMDCAFNAGYHRAFKVIALIMTLMAPAIPR